MRKIVFSNEKIVVDNGINFGFGLFETILFKDEPKFLNFHIERLKNGMEVLGLSKLSEEKELIEKIKSLSLENKALKVLVTEENIILSTRENIYKDFNYKNGFKLKISNVIKNSTSRLVFIKSINYCENIIEKNISKNEGYDDCLFLNEKGNITETSVANIFFIKNKVIYTPKISDGILNGTVREFILRNYKVIEKSIKLDELKDIDEVFITNSLMGIVSVKSIENFKFKDDKIKEIRNFYEEKLKDGVELDYDR